MNFDYLRLVVNTLVAKVIFLLVYLSIIIAFSYIEMNCFSRLLYYIIERIQYGNIIRRQHMCCF